MSAKDLIPLNLRTKEEVQAIGRKGGLVKSEAKTLANKYNGLKRRIKHGSFRKGDVLWIAERVADNKMMALDMLGLLDSVVKETNDPKIRLAALNTYNDIYKSVHGEKIKSENTNYNINVNQTVEDVYARRREQQNNMKKVFSEENTNGTKESE